MEPEQLQKEHYNKISEIYDINYNDAWAQKYRMQFINMPLFKDIDLSGRKVLEAMCGTGLSTQYLLSMGANVTGLDISEQAISSFKTRWPQCKAACASILDTKLPDNSFDCIVVLGGLHHVHPHVNKALSEIHRILQTGGFLCFTEPHTGSLPNIFRKFWYKRDDFFLENEMAIDIDTLKNTFSSKFTFVKEKYFGGIAYLLVLHSIYFRIPLKVKPIYAPALLYLESLVNNLQIKKLSCLVACQWKKK